MSGRFKNAACAVTVAMTRSTKTRGSASVSSGNADTWLLPGIEVLAAYCAVPNVVEGVLSRRLGYDGNRFLGERPQGTALASGLARAALSSASREINRGGPLDSFPTSKPGLVSERREERRSILKRGAIFSRAELLAMYGAECPLPTLLNRLAMPGCSKINTHWDRCGVYYVNPIDGRER
jgi:hypothetical protein